MAKSSPSTAVDGLRSTQPFILNWWINRAPAGARAGDAASAGCDPTLHTGFRSGAVRFILAHFRYLYVYRTRVSRAARSYQPCVNNDWPGQCRRLIFDSCRIDIPLPIAKKFGMEVITLAIARARPNLVQICSRGASGRMGEYSQFLNLYPFLKNSSTYTGQTTGWIFTLDGSNDVDSRRMCIFGVSLNEFAKKTILGVDRRFQPKASTVETFI